MPLIECKAGYAETNIAGTTYSFHQDEYGRYVALVEAIDHIMCLTSVEHYQIVPDKPDFEREAAAEANIDAETDDSLALMPAQTQDPEPQTLPNPLTAPVADPGLVAGAEQTVEPAASNTLGLAQPSTHDDNAAQEPQAVTETVTPNTDDAVAAKPARKRRAKKSPEAVAPSTDGTTSE